MFRAAQMLLCQALKVHYCGRSWCWPRSFPQRKNDVFVQNLLTWFADYPSVSLWNGEGNCDSSDGINKMETGLHSWYSLHNMVAVGLVNYEVLPGEWLGPQTACYIIRDLCKRHYNIWNLQRNKYEQQSIHSNDIEVKQNDSEVDELSNGLTPQPIRLSSILSKPPLQVFVAQEGCIYRPLVEELMKKNGMNSSSLSVVSSATDTNTIETDPYPTKYASYYDNDQHQDNFIASLSMRNKQDRIKTVDDPLSQLLSSSDYGIHPEALQRNSKGITTTACSWDTSLLLLVPLRLGLKVFNSDSYSHSLACTFQLPQSLGFIGGSPRHALWFYSAFSDGSRLFGLDPHTVHSAPTLNFSSSSWNSNINESGPVGCHIELTDDYLRTFLCPTPSQLDFTKIDPSLALGFYCRDRDDFISLCDAITQINAICKGSRLPELFSISDLKPPDYIMDSNFMLSDDLCSNNDHDVTSNTVLRHSNEEDYVLL